MKILDSIEDFFDHQPNVARLLLIVAIFFCALIGCGVQIAFIVLGIILCIYLLSL